MMCKVDVVLWRSLMRRSFTASELFLFYFYTLNVKKKDMSLLFMTSHNPIIKPYHVTNQTGTSAAFIPSMPQSSLTVGSGAEKRSFMNKAGTCRKKVFFSQ